MNLKLNHIQHIGIPVTDINASVNFYTSLGFTNVMPSTFDYNGGKGIVAMMRQKEMIIELYQMPENELHEIRQRKNGHIDHIAFDVDDIEGTYAALQSAGFTIEEAAPVYLAFWEKGCRYFNISGPDGERLEFNEIIK